MEKRIQVAMSSPSLFKIVITGPEATGKSTLAAQLAEHYHTVFVPEYARSYIESLNRPYIFSDVEHIARRQVQEYESFGHKASTILFLDTYLIITKVWFDVVYKKCPDWVIEAIKRSDIDLFLLCQTDLPWTPDNVRENGGEKREQLFRTYQTELEYFGFTYGIVEGSENDRLKKAISIIEDRLGTIN
jgi:NadR type nicotinamide-nucleotide adenylyltransferase